MFSKFSRQFFAAAALAALTAATPALAAPAEIGLAGEAVEARVRHGDLDLASPSDVERLKTRVANQAKRLCATGLERDRITDDIKACRAEVIASGDAQIDRAVQLAVLRQKTRRG